MEWRGKEDEEEESNDIGIAENRETRVKQYVEEQNVLQVRLVPKLITRNLFCTIEPTVFIQPMQYLYIHKLYRPLQTKEI